MKICVSAHDLDTMEICVSPHDLDTMEIFASPRDLDTMVWQSLHGVVEENQPSDFRTSLF